MFDLPKSLEIDGINYDIRTDFRAILDMFIAFEDSSLNMTEKWYVALKIMFIDYDKLTNYEKAIDKIIWFINCGNEDIPKNSEKLFDWEKDFQYIVAPINKSLKQDIRSIDYMHWWTFMGYFNEIGESVFSNIVGIRNKIKKGKKLEDYEREFVSNNPDLISLPEDKYAIELLNKMRRKED